MCTMYTYVHIFTYISVFHRMRLNEFLVKLYSQFQKYTLKTETVILILLLLEKLSFSHWLKLICPNRKFDNYTIYLRFIAIQERISQVKRTMFGPGEHASPKRNKCISSIQQTNIKDEQQKKCFPPKSLHIAS